MEIGPVDFKSRPVELKDIDQQSQQLQRIYRGKSENKLIQIEPFDIIETYDHDGQQPDNNIVQVGWDCTLKFDEQ
jgi:hypothetical protein